MPGDPIYALKRAALFFTLIVIQLALGKKISFPYGVIIGFSPITIGVMAFICDIVLMVFIRLLFDNTSKLQMKFNKLRNRYKSAEEKFRRSRRYSHLQNLGKMGVVILVSIPGAGGVWSGSMLAHILSLNKTDAYCTIIFGSVINTLLFVLGSMGIIHWVA